MTRPGSSSSIRVQDDPAGVKFFHAEGPPCRSAYADLSDQAMAMMG
jgi:hypothetical protein